MDLDRVPPLVHEVLREAGRPMDAAARAHMEPRLGHDFGQVRVHTGTRAAASAHAVQALAYTVGRNIVFAGGRYAPGTPAGRELLAHELTHVVQQGGGHGPDQTATRIEAPNTPEERGADLAARRIASGGMAERHTHDPAAPPSMSLQRQPSPDYQLNLTIDERGRVDVTVSGPKVPIIGNPTIGVRRNPNNTYQVIGGAGGKAVAPSEIPEMLRSTLHGAAGSTSPPAPRTLYVPSCRNLRVPDGTRFMTYDEYRVSQMISGATLPMSQSLYELRLQACSEKPAEVPAPEPKIAPPMPTRNETAVA
jgi:hypothetical protein